MLRTGSGSNDTPATVQGHCRQWIKPAKIAPYGCGNSLDLLVVDERLLVRVRARDFRVAHDSPGHLGDIGVRHGGSS